ncbi:Hypothetical predicted protein [Mytilus galloprovincialis]|uniref:Novel STAND NTPase 3 domain-containing protein n=1 Tax=Mytilus galloprovincialis TaxID=29158 RepID=A0A8B6EGN1_MYTGA|nr:Hypothetical predicted protein [Mytilus galloprovincialis]
MKCLQVNSCVTLTAPSGVGKSFISRHAALFLQKEGYRMIPVYSPTDIRDYYQPGKQTVFIVDDICGNFIAHQCQIENWKQLLPVIDTIIADACCKIIVSCRLQVYKDDKFNILVPFKSCEYNLTSYSLCLTSGEKHYIAQQYIGTSINEIDVETHNSDFFPLLCSLYYDKKHVDVNEFFNIPFDVYKNDLDQLSEHGDEGNYKIGGLALCVLFNNQLEEKWFQVKVTDAQRHIIEDTCDACDINRSTSKARLKKALDTLDGTFICKQNDDENSNIDFSIEIPNENLNSYLQRFIKDWLAGKVTLAFNNTNTQVSSFRQKLLEHLKQLNHSQQVTLVNTKDTGEPKESCASGNTPLLMFCCHGYTDMVQWIIHHDVDVDQCRGDGVTGLGFASQNGHIDIVKLLLEKDPNVNQCDKDGRSPLLQVSQKGHTDIVTNVNLCDNDGRSPLLQVCQKGHTDIVTLLLEKNPNVNQCDKDGCSPLLQAIQNGHADIVRLLLEMNPDVNQCTKYGLTPLILACSKNDIRVVQLLIKHKPKINAQTSDGGIALYFSVRNGIIEITELLLENNADCNICAYSKQTVTETVFRNPSDTLQEYKQSLFDTLVTETSNHVTDYVSSKSVEYAFDVETGSSPLHIACFIGRKDAVHCLLNYNANINIKKEDGTTPLFYACEVGHDYIVRLLLDEGADAQICRLDGKSPLNIATDNGHTSIVKIITEHMEKENPIL